MIDDTGVRNQEPQDRPMGADTGPAPATEKAACSAAGALTETCLLIHLPAVAGAGLVTEGYLFAECSGALKVELHGSTG